MKQVILWGGTGHARVLADALDPLTHAIRAVVDNRAIPSPLEGVPLLHGEEELRQLLASDPAAAGWLCAVAVGGDRGRDRLQLLGLMQSLGLRPLTVVHPRAFVARDATLEEGSQVLAMAAVCASASVGRGAIVNTAASVDHDCRIGPGAHVGPGARIAGEVVVGEAAFVGTGAVVLPRLRIGAGALVGAGAVVIRDVPDGTVVVGNPARLLKRR